MFGTGWRLFTLLGFEVRLDWTWVFLAALVTWSLASSVFPFMFEGLAPATYWWMGAAGLIGLMVSLVLHELSHAIVARRYGLPISGITLFVFGGVAHMEREPDSARAELWMAIAGPAASVVIAAACYLGATLSEAAGAPLPVWGVLAYLAYLNTILAVFNMIPAFPLDGGRVLRAALWAWRGDIRWATRIASSIAGLFGFALIALGAVSVLTGNLVGGAWYVLIGLFVRSASASANTQVVMRRALEGEPIGRFMQPDPVTVAPQPSLRQFVEEYLYRYYHDMFPVTDDGRLLGCVTVAEVKAAPHEDWDRLTVGDVMRPCDDTNTVDARRDAMQVLSLMQRTGNARMMVTDNGQLVGIVALKDLMRLLSLKIDLEDVG